MHPKSDIARRREAPPVESGARVKGAASLPKAGAEGTLDAGEHSATIEIPPSQQAHPSHSESEG